jgi:streptogramin lyase
MAYELLATVSTSTTPSAAFYSNGSIWVAALSSVYRIDPATAAITATIGVTPAASGQFVEDQYGYVWFMGVGRVLTRIDPSDNTTSTVTVFTSGTAVPSLSLASGDLWVQLHGISSGAASRVFRIDPSTFAVTDTDNAICGTSLCVFFVEQGGSVWASKTTFLGMNILQVNPSTNTVTSTTNVSASVVSFVSAVYAYGYLWCATGNGLLRFNTSTLVGTFPTANGQQGVVASNSNLYFDDYQDVYVLNLSTLGETKIIDRTSGQLGLFNFDDRGNAWLPIVSGSNTLKYVIPAVGWVRGHAWG